MPGSTVSSVGPAPAPAAPSPEPRARRLTIVRGDDAVAIDQPTVPRPRRRCYLACERTPAGGVEFVGHTSDGRTPVRATVDLAHDNWLDVAGRMAELLDVYEAVPGLALAKP